MKRRTFIQNTALAVMSGLCLPRSVWAQTAKLERIGVQLYTLRTLAETDMHGVLKNVAAIGYNEVELHTYFDHSPETVRGWLDDLNLTSPSIHVGIDMLRKDLDGVLAAAKIVGHQYIVCPYLGAEERTLAHYEKHAAFFNKAGAACQAEGITFAYHNHEFEFEATDGKVHYDVLLENTDPALVEMELDLFWIAKAGKDPVEYFERYPGRFTLCHVKDMTEDAQMTAVGQGKIDFKRIFAHAEQAGLVHFFVEHDRPEDPMASVTSSYHYLAHLEY